MSEANEPFDLEAVYDAEIAPLMAQILAACKKHRMPMLASFQYAERGDDGQDYCTSFLEFAGRKPGALSAALDCVNHGPPLRFVITTERGPNIR